MVSSDRDPLRRLGNRADVEKILDLQSTRLIDITGGSSDESEAEGPDPSGSSRIKRQKVNKAAIRRAAEEDKVR